MNNHIRQKKKTVGTTHGEKKEEKKTWSIISNL